MNAKLFRAVLALAAITVGLRGMRWLSISRIVLISHVTASGSVPAWAMAHSVARTAAVVPAA